MVDGMALGDWLRDAPDHTLHEFVERLLSRVSEREVTVIKSWAIDIERRRRIRQESLREQRIRLERERFGETKEREDAVRRLFECAA